MPKVQMSFQTQPQTGHNDFTVLKHTGKLLVALSFAKSNKLTNILLPSPLGFFFWFLCVCVCVYVFDKWGGKTSHQQYSSHKTPNTKWQHRNDG